MLKCDNQYCIYQDEGVCLFQTIAVNEYGMCAHCRLLDIDEEELKARKEISYGLFTSGIHPASPNAAVETKHLDVWTASARNRCRSA